MLFLNKSKGFILSIMKKYKTLILYAVFGVLTTLINIAAYHVTYDILKIGNVISVAIAWVLSVIFAYITNKIWVFESREADFKTVLYEVASFFACRASTGVLDLVIMYFAVDVFSLNALLWKTISNVIVIVLNYAASKLIIFRKKK